MNLTSPKNIGEIVCLACLATSSALAQPVIVAQPTNQFLASVKTAGFSVVATGAPALTYQWLFKGVPIVASTNSSLTLTSPQPAQWGFYSVVVSSPTGSVTSQLAELKVFAAAPHSLSGIEAEPGGSVALKFAGETTAAFAPYYDIYPLEASSNLLDWEPLATLQRANASLDALQFVDSGATNFSQRFYRAATGNFPTPDPGPTGPYPVGTFSMPLTNALRNNAKFMVTFWYPAATRAGLFPAKYVDPQVAQGGFFYDLTGSGGDFISQVTAFFSHSLPNAPIATNRSACPVVLYDPGGGGHRRENTDKTEDLASWGYVVAGLDTTDSSVSVFPDGEVVNDEDSLTSLGALDGDIEGRLRDMQFLLDQLEVMNTNDPRFGGRLDVDKIGAFGWSLGGASTIQLCLRDSRCKAGANLDGACFETDVLAQPLNVPILLFREDTGTDPFPGGVLDGFPDDRMEVFSEQATNAYWVRLLSTIHGYFADPGLVADSASLNGYWGAPMSGQFLPGARASQIVRAYLLSFFNKFLRGEDDHLLDGPTPAIPEVIQFLSKADVSAPPKYPSAALLEGPDGNFYGATEFGGASGSGAVFRMTPAGALTTLVSFNGPNGSQPVATLVQGGDGNFYGVTEFGGTNGNNGTVFQMTPDGTLTTLVYFNGANGRNPYAPLTVGSNGNFYGSTFAGGAHGSGTIFQVTPAGELATLVSFDNGANGGSPFAALAQGADGNIYGTTSQGAFPSPDGTGGLGTVFKMTTSGVLTTLVTFTGRCGNPAGGLLQGADGFFYGTTPKAGNLSLNAGGGLGTVFKMSSAGTLTRLVAFDGAGGSYPAAGLVQGADGNFYGTTMGGGGGGAGTVFKMSPSGSLTTLHTFSGPDGRYPQAPLIQGSDGNLYGTTKYGGPSGFGTVFKMNTSGALTTLVSFGSDTNSP
jgi:uncharacterized repeat protein (TIGR03803 family)